MNIDEEQDRAVEDGRKGKPYLPSARELAVLRKETRPQIGRADADADGEISQIEQNPAGLDRQREMAGLEPGRISEIQTQRYIDGDREQTERGEGDARPVAQRIDRLAPSLYRAGH